MTNRRFYKTTITVTIVSEERVPKDVKLKDVAGLIYYGDRGYSGTYKFNDEEINAVECAKLLTETGDEPEFFDLTEDGEDLK